MTNEELRDAINRSQAMGLSLAGANKEKLRVELKAQMAEFLNNGGQIKQLDSANRNEQSQFNNRVVKIKHGTSHQFNKRSCRCVVCVEWAVKKGILKPGYKRVAA